MEKGLTTRWAKPATDYNIRKRVYRGTSQRCLFLFNPLPSPLVLWCTRRRAWPWSSFEYQLRPSILYSSAFSFSRVFFLSPLFFFSFSFFIRKVKYISPRNCNLLKCKEVRVFRSKKRFFLFRSKLGELCILSSNKRKNFPSLPYPKSNFFVWISFFFTMEVKRRE